MMRVSLCSFARTGMASVSSWTPFSRSSDCLNHLEGEAGVDDVGGGEAQVDEAGLFGEAVGDGTDEGVEVVVHLALVLVPAGDVVAGAAIFWMAPGGMTPRAAQASQTANSTASHLSSLFSSAQTRAIWGRV